MQNKRMFMFNMRLPRFFYLFMSFSLLVAPLPVSALAEDLVISVSEFESTVVAENPDVSYVHFDKELSDIARVIAQISNLDDSNDSSLHALNKHLSNGFSCAEYDVVLETLEYAENVLQDNHKKLDPDQAQQLATQLDTVIKQGIHAHGKLKIGKRAKFKSNVKIKKSLSVTDLAVANCIDNLCVNNLSVADAIIDNLTLTGPLSFTDLSVVDLAVSGTLSVNDLVVDNCMDDLCVNDLSVVDGSVSGTLSVNDEIVQNITATTLSATDAVIDNLTVTGALSFTSLLVVDATVSGTLSVNDEIVQNITATTLSATDAVIDNLTVTGALSFTSLLVVDATVSGTLSVNDEIVQNITATTLSATDAVIDN